MYSQQKCAWYSLLMLFTPVLLGMEAVERPATASNNTTDSSVIRAYTLQKQRSFPKEEKTHHVDLSAKNLTSLESLHTIQILDKNQATTLSHLPNLRLLLVMNKLTDVSELIILTNLTELDLSHNPLQSVSPVAFLVALKKLDISSTGLTSLPDEMSHLTKLAKLDLSNNRLREFPRVIAALPALKKLNFAGNRAENLPAEISRLQNLKELDLSNTLVDLSPKNIDRLRSLTKLGVLKLCQNGLTELPASFGTLTQLRDLHLDNNRLRDLPMTLNALRSLSEEPKSKHRYRTLSLSHNEFEEMPNVIPFIKNLGRLLANYNKLSNLPEEMGKHAMDVYLFRLELASNRFQKIPKVIFGFATLRFLILNDNLLTEIDAAPGFGFICLELRHNRISSLPHFFSTLNFQHCARLDLSDNRLGPTVNGVYQPIASVNEMAMFQDTWFNWTKSFVKDYTEVKNRLLNLTKPQSKESNKAHSNPAITCIDPSGYLAKLPREILEKVYLFHNPPALSDKEYYDAKAYEPLYRHSFLYALPGALIKLES